MLNLTKGQTLNLTKDAGITKAAVGLGSCRLPTVSEPVVFETQRFTRDTLLNTISQSISEAQRMKMKQLSKQGL